MPGPADINQTQELQVRMSELQAYQNQSTQDRQREMAMDAQPARDLMGWLTRGYGANSLNELRQSPHMMDQVMAQAIPLLGAYGAERLGLSPSAMILANQNAFAQGGMHINGPQGPISLNGYGTAADALSTANWGQMSKHFFHPGGALNLENTFGASRDDIGATMQELQRRGAFSGMEAGTYDRMTTDKLRSLREGASSRGDTAALREMEGLGSGDLLFTPNPGLSNKMTEFSSNALRAVQELRQVLGNLKPQDIMAELERLTGVDIGRPGNLDSAMVSFRSRLSQGAAAGLTPHDTLAFNAATTSTLDAMLSRQAGVTPGSFYGASAAMSGVIDARAMAAWKENRAGGGNRMLPEIAAHMASDSARLLTENPELVEAMVGATQVSGAGRDRLLAEIDAAGKAGTVEQRAEARRTLGLTLEQVTGQRSGSLINMYGGDALMGYVNDTDRKVLERGMKSVLNMDQSAMIGDYRRMIGSFTPESGIAQALGGADKAAAFAHQIAQTIPPEVLNRYQAAVSQGGMSAGASLISSYNLSGFGDASHAFQMADAHLRQASGGSGGMGDFLNLVRTQSNMSNQLTGMVTQGGVGSQNAAASLHDQTKLPTKGMQPMGAWARFEQGLFGGNVPMEDKYMLEYAKGAGASVDSFNLTDDGSGIDTDAAGAKKMRKNVLGMGMDLYKLLGVKSDQELSDALRKPGGASIVGGIMANDERAIAGLDQDTKGRMRISMVTDPDKLRDQHDKELAKAQKDAGIPMAPQAKAAQTAKQNQPIQVTLNMGGVAQTIMGTISNLFGSKSP